MATGVQWLKSTDSSAPTLSGTAGNLTTLWDALLVNGYGAKSAMGVGGAGAWTIDKTGTNKRVYKPSAGNRFFLRCQDDAPGAAGAQEARVVSYETVSTVDAGTNPMPTVAQATNGHFIRKSAAASGTARAWKALGDDRTFYFFNISGDTALVYTAFCWGDFYSHITADAYRTMMIARSSENSSTVNSTPENFLLTQQTASFSTALTGHYIQRNRNATVGALACQKTISPGFGPVTSISPGSNLTYPNPEDGGLYILPFYLNDPTTGGVSSIRGRMRGLWYCNHATSNFSDGDTFSGVGDYAGKTFEILKGFVTATTALIVVETSDTWDTSS